MACWAFRAVLFVHPQGAPMWSKTGGSLKALEGNEASHEEDIIWSLHTQLTLQQELCTQFEIDLGARDKLVAALTIRLGALEKESENRKRAVHSWKKKATDLEKLCRHLEERDSLASTIQQSQADITELGEELGVTEEASGQVVRQLHDQITQLKLEKSDVEAERNTLVQGVEKAEAEIAALRGELSVATTAKIEAMQELHSQVSQFEQERNDLHAERDNFSSEISRLRAHIQQLQKNSATMEVTIVQLNKQLNQDKEDIDGLNIALESKQQELELVCINS